MSEGAKREKRSNKDIVEGWLTYSYLRNYGDGFTKNKYRFVSLILVYETEVGRITDIFFMTPICQRPLI